LVEIGLLFSCNSIELKTDEFKKLINLKNKFLDKNKIATSLTSHLMELSSNHSYETLKTIDSKSSLHTSVLCSSLNESTKLSGFMLSQNNEYEEEEEDEEIEGNSIF
jgi:hypothetical protein